MLGPQLDAQPDCLCVNLRAGSVGAAAGDAQAVAEWFSSLGYTLPYGVNVADFILDLSSGVVTTKKLDGEESRVHCIACSERFLAAHPLGFTQGAPISEAELGFELWNSAQVCS